MNYTPRHLAAASGLSLSYVRRLARERGFRPPFSARACRAIVAGCRLARPVDLDAVSSLCGVLARDQEIARGVQSFFEWVAEPVPEVDPLEAHFHGLPRRLAEDAPPAIRRYLLERMASAARLVGESPCGWTLVEGAGLLGLVVKPTGGRRVFGYLSQLPGVPVLEEAVVRGYRDMGLSDDEMMLRLIDEVPWIFS